MLEITPNRGIGPVMLGMSRTEVSQAMQSLSPQKRHTQQRDIYCQGKLVVDFQHEKAVAICINKDPIITTLEPRLFGFNPLKQQAHKTVMRMSLRGNYDHEDPQLGMSYIYPKLGIYFWRDTTPENLQREMRLQRTAENTSHTWYAQAVQDYKQFHAVGVFTEGYL